MSIHVCKCGGEWHLRYPGMTQEEAQSVADRINAGALYTHSRAEAPVGPAYSTCATCKGTGVVGRLQCGECHGLGMQKSEALLSNENKSAQEKSVQPADERQAFEAEQVRHVQAYSKGRHLPHLERTGDGYQNPLVHAAWQGWQARAAIAPTKEQ